MSNRPNGVDIAFAIFNKNTENDQILNQAINFGAMVNRFDSSFRFIATPRYFRKSRHIVDLMRRYQIGSDQFDLVFNDWLSRTAIDFIQSDSDFLLILDASLAPKDGFEQWTQELLDKLPHTLDAISISPTHPSAEELLLGSTEPVKTSHGVNSMGFVLTRRGAQKFIKTFDQSPSGGFSHLISLSKMSCATILESSPDQPVYFLDILNSQNVYESQLRDMRVEPAETEEMQQIGQTQGQQLDKAPVRVQAFISHWYSTWNNIEKVESACRDFGYDTTVLNTTIHDRQGWANSIPISFFRQFEYACKNFDPTNEYMLFITADVKSYRWGEFFAYADQVLRLDNVGTFSPTLTFQEYQLSRFPSLKFESESPLAIIFHNDILSTFIHKNVILELQLFFDYFNSREDTFAPAIGHGLDTIIREITHKLNLFNLRDRSNTVLHPFSRSYDSSQAGQEGERILQFANDYFKLANFPESVPIDERIKDWQTQESFGRLVQYLTRLN